jgi:hypothetical protein
MAPTSLYFADPQAVCVDYGVVALSWAGITAGWTELRLVRNSNGAPISVDDGVVVLSSFTSLNTYTDSVVTPGKRYYYGLFFNAVDVDDGWVNAGSTDVLVAKDHGYVDALWDRLPNLYKLDSFQNLTGTPNPTNPLYRFLTLFGFELDQTRAELDELLHLDAGSVPEILLPALLNQLGFTSEPELNPRARRQLALGAVELYKDKGKRLALENLTNILTDWDASVTIGPNKMLDNLDALTDLSFGRWDTMLDRCTLEVRNNTTALSAPYGRGYVAVIPADPLVPFSLSTSKDGRTGRLHSIPIIQGRTYAASLYVYGGNTAQVHIDWYGIAGELVATSAGSATSLAGGGWLRMANVSIAPPGARYAALRVVSNETTLITEGGSGLTSFTLTYGPDTTVSIAASSTAAQVQSALEGLPSIGVGNVQVTAPLPQPNNGPWTVSFIGALAGRDASPLLPAPTGGTGTVTAAVTPTAMLLLNGAQFEEVAPFGVPGPYKPARQALIALLAELINEVYNPNGIGGIQNWRGATAGLSAGTDGLLLHWSSGDQVSAGDRRYVATTPRVPVEPGETVTLFAQMRAASIAEDGVPFDAPFSVELDVVWHLRQFSGSVGGNPYHYEDTDLIRLTDTVSQGNVGTAAWQDVVLQYTVPADGSVTAIEGAVAITRLRQATIGPLRATQPVTANSCVLGGTGTLAVTRLPQPDLLPVSGPNAASFGGSGVLYINQPPFSPAPTMPPLPATSTFDAVRFRHVALIKGRFDEVFYFSGDSASTSVEYLWEGTPNASRSHYYSRRGIKEQRLLELAPQFLPHPQTHWLDEETVESLAFVTAAPAQPVFIPQWALINYDIYPAPSPLVVVGSSVEIDWARSSQTWGTLATAPATWASVLASYPDWNTVNGA